MPVALLSSPTAPTARVLPSCARVRGYDPQGRANAEPLLPGIEWCESALDAATGADVTVVLTEWNEFRALDLVQLKQAMRGDILVDLRNVYRPETAETVGFNYRGVGRGDLSER